MKTIISVSMLIAVAVFWMIVIIPINGIHATTGEGDHTGYITAAERTGLFFKRDSIYLKTNVQSSQEDMYCVVDPAVYAELQQDTVSGVNVNVHFYTWLIAGARYCDHGSAGIISSVTNL